MLNPLHTWVDGKYGALVETTISGSERIIFDNSFRIARILYRLQAYRRLSWHMVRSGVPVREIVRSQFPYVERYPHKPILLEVEFTNYCDLRCTYCTSPLGLRPRGFMQKEVLNRLVEGVRELGIKRVRVIGNGEPTLHPDFASFTKRLGDAAPYVSVPTNGQWRNANNIISAMLQAPLAMIEVSVDAADKAGYERARIGGKFERLLDNLRLLKERRGLVKSSALINLRLMLHPSERPLEKQLKAFWSQFADTVMPQYLFEERSFTGTDLYKSFHHATQAFPKCSQPFNLLGVNWNGNVPLCSNSVEQVGPPGLILGNLVHDGLKSMWDGATMRTYREGHWKRTSAQMPICRGCTGS